MTTELRGHLYDFGDGFLCVRGWHDDAYVIAVSVPRNDLPAETLQFIKPGTRCRLVLEPEAKDEAG